MTLPYYDRKLHIIRLVRQAKDRAKQAGKGTFLYKLDNKAGDKDQQVCRRAWALIMGIGTTQLDNHVSWVKEVDDSVAPEEHGNKVGMQELWQPSK